MPNDPLRELLEAAAAARANAHAPYSRFRVGCAIRAADGRVFVGANVENAAYPQSQCAEATAIGAMVTAGARDIAEILVLAESDGPCTPCGGCRQRIAEFAAAGTKVHAAGPDGVRRSYTLGELLPAQFGRGQLPDDRGELARGA